VPLAGQTALRALLADLPLVPTAQESAQLIGAPALTLPALAVLARHVGQGLRDHNLSLAGDRARLRVERRKLVFLDGAALLAALADGDTGPVREAVLFVADATPGLSALFDARQAVGLATFLTSVEAITQWRRVEFPHETPAA
jgi:hypothetical protein